MYYKQINDPNYTDYVIEEATNLLEEFGEPTMEHQYEFTDSKEQTVEKEPIFININTNVNIE